MKFLLLLITFCAATLRAEDCLPPAAPPYYRVRYEPSATPGELVFGVSFTLWIPSGVKTLRGVIVHQMEYVKDGNVSDSTPPPSPTSVRVNASGGLAWDAAADLESGIAAFLIELDGVEIGRVPEKSSGSVGRQIFQKTNYSDTPTPPFERNAFHGHDSEARRGAHLSRDDAEQRFAEIRTGDSRAMNRRRLLAQVRGIR